MTPLSKDDVDTAAEKFDYSDFSGEFRTRLDGLHAFAEHIATLARADLVAENERLRGHFVEERNRTLSLCNEVAQLIDQTTATRTALAAAEARESATRAILDQVMDDIRSEAFLFDGGNGISADTEDAADNLLNQPSDDSALREMIAGVYAECAQACKSFQGKHRAMVFNDELERCVCAIRALAEKAKGE